MIQYPKSENSEGAENQIGADEGKQLVIEKTGEFHTESIQRQFIPEQTREIQKAESQQIQQIPIARQHSSNLALGSGLVMVSARLSLVAI